MAVGCTAFDVSIAIVVDAAVADATKLVGEHGDVVATLPSLIQEIGTSLPSVVFVVPLVD